MNNVLIWSYFIVFNVLCCGKLVIIIESVLNLKPVEIKYIKNSLNFVFDAFARMQTEPHY